jgi:hypothetical protein
MYCEVWKSALALQVLVVPSRMYKWSINPFANPNPLLVTPSRGNVTVINAFKNHNVI